MERAIPVGSEQRTIRAPGRYRLVVQGQLSARLLELLEEPAVGEPRCRSVVTCEIVDQTRLQAVLRWLQDEDVELLSFEPVDP
jgi:hypothetical protein